jgi:TPR repeat protein
MEAGMSIRQTMAAILAAGLMAPAGAGAAEDAFERGMRAYERSHWQEAMAWFEVAAEDEGAVRVKEILAYMNLLGPRLYPGLEQDVGRGKAWLHRAAAEGSAECARLIALIDHPVRAPAGAVVAAAVFGASEGE